MENAILIQWASKYEKAGWSLIPINTKSKEPLIPWKEFQTRRASMTEIEGWIKKWPSMNLGVVTGQVSSLVVVDLDGINGARFGCTQKIVSSVTQHTGNGKQLFYKWTEHIDNSASKIAPGVDIRGDGGFVVVPPSIHPNGKRYRWERFLPDKLMPMPDFFLVNQEAGGLEIKHKPEGWIAKALEEMKIGNIDNTLTSVLGRLRHDGWTSADANTLLQPHAIRSGATDGHLEEKIKNIWNRYESATTVPKSSVQSIYGQSSNVLSIHSPADDDSFNQFSRSLEPTAMGGIQTGFPTLDKFFEGGLKSERLFTVAARTGTGKTNFAIALAANLCKQGKKVLFFSTEFQYEKIWQRYSATLSQSDNFREHAFHVCDSFSPRIDEIEKALIQIKPDVFIVDHINHLSEDKETLTQFMSGCNFLQRKYECQGVMIAQLNRQADWVENGKRVEPRMSMIKSAGSIEQMSSRVLLLSETRVTPEMCEIVGVLDKNDSGERGLINFALLKHPFKFVEL